MDLLQVMNTGHDGSMGTVHANTPLDACTRVETLALMDDTKIPDDAVRKMVASAIHVIVQTSRFQDGSRKISHISEVLGVDAQGNYITKDIYRFHQTDKLDDGQIVGELTPCGYIPSFFRRHHREQAPLPQV